MKLENVGTALRTAFPNASPVNDYNVVDRGDGKGEVIIKWNLQESEPETQEEIDALLLLHEPEIVEREARRQNDFPTLEDRISSLEDGLNLKDKMKEVRDRTKAEKEKEKKDKQDNAT